MREARATMSAVLALATIVARWDSTRRTRTATPAGRDRSGAGPVR
ncbi:hypothetical protein ABZ816_04060 [Actinosynnema sp. NPDC047251]|nr:hypothetical protein [Saccharothrix espanaensis]